MTTTKPPPGFEAFWKAYPNKVGKFVALQAFAKAVKRGDTLEMIMRGLEHYIATKHSYANWQHPSTFLNQRRYLDVDQPAPEMTRERTRTTSAPNWDDEFGRFFGERSRPDTRDANRGGQSVDLFAVDRPRTLHG